MKTKSSTVLNDIPMKLIKEFGVELSYPLANILNRGIASGEYPHIWKFEIVTPVPKVFPPSSPEQLRKISGLKNFAKISEKIISEFVIADMKKDPSQYGNEKGLSTNHYLIKMVNKILTVLERNSPTEAMAVLAQLVDWKQAFPRQCHKLGVESLIKNGVRKELVPILINYFQDRKMVVKWHGELSSERNLPGGGPQGATMGILEYISQTTGNVNFVSEDERYKFIDDLSILECINLVSAGICSYNFNNHVASDIGIDQHFLDSSNIKSQEYIDRISKWTIDNKMKLNENKTKILIVNFTHNFQFTTRIFIQDSLIEILDQTKLLGTILSSDLTWRQNTSMLIKKSYARMEILRKLYAFNVPAADLVQIYIIYIRSLLEQSCVVWASSITEEESVNLERVQKIALRIALKESYISYQNALKVAKLQTLSQRREQLCLKFAQSCLKNKKTESMFPLNPCDYDITTRHREKYKVQQARTERLSSSAIPNMQRLLNKYNV